MLCHVAPYFLFTDGEAEAQRRKDPWPKASRLPAGVLHPSPPPASTEERTPNWDVACFTPHFAGLSPGLLAEVLSGTQLWQRRGKGRGGQLPRQPSPCGRSQYLRQPRVPSSQPPQWDRPWVGNRDFLRPPKVGGVRGAPFSAFLTPVLPSQERRKSWADVKG